MDDGHVQRMKAAGRRHQSALDDLSGEITRTTAEEGRQIAALGESVGGFVAISSSLAPQLVAATYDDERQWLEPALRAYVPETVNSPHAVAQTFEKLDLRPRHKVTP